MSDRRDPGASGAGSEFSDVADRFGVGHEQVRRDHLISHALAAISQIDDSDHVVFVGGTALSRTLLPDLRLSEDIDLIATSDRRHLAQQIADRLEDGLARTHGRISWTPHPADTRRSTPAVLRTSGGINVQIQILGSTGRPGWPTTTVSLVQRYSDAPPARMRVLTPAAAVASKLAAWHDRRTPRDLYDLWALADGGYLDGVALDLYRRYGPTGANPSHHDFRGMPSGAAWTYALSHQCRLRVNPEEAAQTVIHAVDGATDLRE